MIFLFIYLLVLLSFLLPFITFSSSSQADVCHAYQILKRGGLKDENIIVFMYDDIAFDRENPRPGVIINSPNGSDVYHGVPKVIIFISIRSYSSIANRSIYEL